MILNNINCLGKCLFRSKWKFNEISLVLLLCDHVSMINNINNLHQSINFISGLSWVSTMLAVFFVKSQRQLYIIFSINSGRGMVTRQLIATTCTGWQNLELHKIISSGIKSSISLPILAPGYIASSQGKWYVEYVVRRGVPWSSERHLQLSFSHLRIAYRACLSFEIGYLKGKQRLHWQVWLLRHTSWRKSHCGRKKTVYIQRTPFSFSTFNFPLIISNEKGWFIPIRKGRQCILQRTVLETPPGLYVLFCFV